MQPSLTTYRLAPKNGGAPKQLIVLLHGLGSNGQDLIGLAPFFAAALPDALFVSPDAPFPCDMAPFGRQWFSLQDRSMAAMLGGVRKAAPILDQYLDDMLTDNGLQDAQMALVGFSQGTMMSLYTGPRRKNTIAGILGYSGALITDENDTVRNCPVHLIHGDLDDVLPVAAYHDARQRLEASGFTVTGGVTSGLPHSIDQAGIESGKAFLKSIF